MLHRISCACCLFFLAISSLLTFVSPTTASASSPKSTIHNHTLADFPTVDPNYIYSQLFYMVTNFQHREAGYDDNLPVNVNGHDEFANYWSQELMRDVSGFGAQVRRDAFNVAGWQERPATVPAFNVEVTVPGVTHPEQVVVIGCHYDGEAISTQSANDDGSGCAIELGVARAMGMYWRSHHTYPARTLRFVIFDAEEQGLYGSFHYLNSTVNGDTKNIVAMFNEEQSGIAYPLRYLGKMANPLLPFYVDMSPLNKSQLYPNQGKLTQQQRASITTFRALMQQAVTPVFAQFQALGYQTLAYHSDNNQDVTQSVFIPSQLNNLHLEDDTLGGSDQIPFTLAGQPISLDGSASFDPTNASNTLNYAWDFGDGATATGATVNHIYNNAGTYTLTLTVHSAIGSRQVSKVLTIVPKTTVYDNPYAGFKANGIPPSNPAVILPTPNDIPPGQGIPTPPLTGSNPVIAFLLIALALALVIAFIVTLVLRRRSKRA